MKKLVVLAAAVTLSAHASAGQVAKGASYTVSADPDGECKVAGCTIKVTIAAAQGFHVNKDYPYKLKADDVAGVEFLGTDAGGRNVFSKAAGDFKLDPKDEKLGYLSVRFKAKAAGPVKITGKLKLSVCNEANCQMDTADLAMPVSVK